MGGPTNIAALAGLCSAQSMNTAVIARVSSPERATPDALVFAEDKKSLAAALASQAGAILARREDAGNSVADKRLIWVAEPRLSFARCAAALEAPRRAAEIHPSAVIDPTAKLGARVRVGAGAVIEADATIGDDVVLRARACVGFGVQIGNRVVVQAGAVLGSFGFGYVRDAQTGEYVLFPQQGELVVEDDVEIGANTTIDRGALGETRIGRGTKIDNLVHIGHNCRVGRNVVIAAQVGVSGSAVIEDGAILAGQVGISRPLPTSAGRDPGRPGRGLSRQVGGRSGAGLCGHAGGAAQRAHALAGQAAAVEVSVLRLWP